jgi:hypothetical protein
MSWPDMMSPWAGAPAPDPLRVNILGGLAYSALDLRERIAGAIATSFEHTYMQVATGTTAWCDLAVTLAAEMS